MRTAIRFFREDPFWAGLLLASCLVCLPAVWAPSYLPLLDHPQHVGIIETLADYGDAEKRFAEYYAIDFDIETYGLYYWPAAALAKVVGAEGASRIMLSLYVLLLPFGMVALLEAQGRSRRLALLSAPLIFNTNFCMGFEAFCLSVAMLPWILALADRCFAERTVRREIALAVWLSLLFLMHALTFLLGAGLVGLRSLQRGRGIVGLLRRNVPVACGTVLFAVWGVRSFLLRPGCRFADIGILDYFTKDQLLEKLPGYLMGGFRSQDDSGVLIVFGLTVLACLFASQSWRAPDRSGEPLLVRYRGEIAVVVTFVLYLTVPIQIPGIWYICPRLVFPAAILLVAAIRFEPRGLAAWVLVPVAVVNLAWPVRVLGYFRAVSEQAGDLDDAVAVMNPGRKTLGLIFYGDEGVMTWNPFLHAGAYAIVEKGGGLGFSFAQSPGAPVRYRAPEQFPHPNEWRPGDFGIDAHGRFYDYLLVRGRRSAHPNPFGRQYLRAGIDYFGEWWSVYHVLPAPLAPRYDFVGHIDGARVELERDGVASACRVTEPGRYQCGPRIWEYVGAIDGNFGGQTWRCIWVHPYEKAALRIVFPAVPIGSAIRGLYGLVDSAVVSTAPRLGFRVGDDPPVVIGHEGKGILSLIHVDTSSRSGTTADVTVEVTSDDIGSQHACFLASTVE